MLLDGHAGCNLSTRIVEPLSDRAAGPLLLVGEAIGRDYPRIDHASRYRPDLPFSSAISLVSLVALGSSDGFKILRIPVVT